MIESIDSDESTLRGEFFPEKLDRFRYRSVEPVSPFSLYLLNPKVRHRVMPRLWE